MCLPKFFELFSTKGFPYYGTLTVLIGGEHKSKRNRSFVRCSLPFAVITGNLICKNFEVEVDYNEPKSTQTQGLLQNR